MTGPGTSTAALQVEGLRIELASGAPVVDGVSLTVAPAEILGLVGESGSGKTTTALALLGYRRRGLALAAGSVEIAGATVSGDERDVRRQRGSLVSYVPQDPANALNPALRIRAAIEDMLAEHAASHPPSASVTSALESVQLPGDPAFAERFPHQLSGGQQQRVSIATALVCEPPLIVLDEPTTGLDVLTQARILEELRRLRDEHRLAMVYVSHDLAVVGQIADRVAVMYAGRIVEEGPVRVVLGRPRHPYTRGLVESIPDHARPSRVRGLDGVAPSVGDRPAGCAFAPRCPQSTTVCTESVPALEPTGDEAEVRCFHWRDTPVLKAREARVAEPVAERRQPLVVTDLRAEHRSRGVAVIAAHDVSFALEEGGCLALVGESGSGKTTIARCVAGLHLPAGGVIALDGEPLAGAARKRSVEQRRRIQIVFQNPYDSLNPRHRIGDSLSRPGVVLRGLSRRDSLAEVPDLLARVRLPARLATRFPGELSGGERQRVAIARALAAEPAVLICDEITSALDVSVQAAILELLDGLRRELGLAMLLITHDLGVVATVADDVLVLERGAVCERGPVSTILAVPTHPYTRSLLEAAPRLPS